MGIYSCNTWVLLSLPLRNKGCTEGYSTNPDMRKEIMKILYGK